MIQCNVTIISFLFLSIFSLSHDSTEVILNKGSLTASIIISICKAVKPIKIFNNSNLSRPFRVEEIIGGYPAFESNYKYQAAIVGKYNSTNVAYILCGAAIISNKLLLSVARCFIGINNTIRKIAFYAVVRQTLISNYHIIPRDIVKVYTYLYIRGVNQNDLAVVELKDSLQLEINSNLARLDIPKPGDDLWKIRSGTVTGYGAQGLNESSVLEGRERVRLNSVDTHHLQYVFVKKLSDPICIAIYGHVYRTNSFCGFLNPDHKFIHRGICTGDIGNPFVIDMKIYAVASKYSPECNDVLHGSLYTLVSDFYSFVNGLITGTPINNTLTHYNSPHFGQVPAH